MSSVLDSAEYLMLIFQIKLLSGPRWWVVGPGAPPVWPPLYSTIDNLVAQSTERHFTISQQDNVSKQ